MGGKYETKTHLHTKMCKTMKLNIFWTTVQSVFFVAKNIENIPNCLSPTWLQLKKNLKKENIFLYKHIKI